jgi:Dynamin family
VNRLEEGIFIYQEKRRRLIDAIDAYRAWAEHYGEANARQSLRLYDLSESLKNDRLMLAFVAEFSRGKSELINALFFSDFKRRLLPSDAGRTTMCPTELFHDPDMEPVMRLLPIETRFREDSIQALKRLPVEWSNVQLDIGNPDSMVEAFTKLAETKMVSRVEARALGLLDDEDTAKTGDQVQIPVWRYALVNYPHPLLTGGLSILDTPGLNAIGSEPELTLSAIPNAHAVLFLLAFDTGVTRSDLTIWKKCVYGHVSHSVAVLNKIDMLWDDLKSEAEVEASIRRQVESTARQLDLDPANVLAVSAQKALIARVRGDAALLRRSNIGALENLLAQELIPLRESIMSKSVVREVGAMVLGKRSAINDRLQAAEKDLRDLRAVGGRNTQVIGKLSAQLRSDRESYEETLRHFSLTQRVLAEQGGMLLEQLAPERINAALEEAKRYLGDRWTTSGLFSSMQELFRLMENEFSRTVKNAADIHKLLTKAYTRFHERHGFELMTPLTLDLDIFKSKLEELSRATREFCNDPVNIITAKNLLIRKFYTGLVSQASRLFSDTRKATDSWLRASLDPLLIRIKEHKAQFDHRLDNLNNILGNMENLESSINELQTETNTLRQKLDSIASIEQTLTRVAPVKRDIANEFI